MKLKEKKGITLIALVVTIVVLLILAGVSINTIFSDSGIIKRASGVQEKMDRAKEDDLKGINDLNNLINDFNNIIDDRTGALSNLKSYTDVEKNDDGTTKSNSKYRDEEKNVAVIPEGYQVSEKNGEKKISEGLVIKDSDGNEFVWIPVDNINEYKRTAWNGETLIDTINDNMIVEDMYYEKSEASSSIGGGSILGRENVKVQKAMVVINKLASFDDITSIKKYGGFYMGRYEASYNSSTDKIETKKGKTPYTNIDISKLSYYSKILYNQDAPGMLLNYIQESNNVKVTKLAIHQAGEETNDTPNSSGNETTESLRKHCNWSFKQTVGCNDKVVK